MSVFIYSVIISESGCVLRLYCVLQPVGSGFNVFEGRPKLAAWRDRVKKGLGEKLFDEAHEQIMSLESIPPMQDRPELEQFKSRIQKYFSWVQTEKTRVNRTVISNDLCLGFLWSDQLEMKLCSFVFSLYKLDLDQDSQPAELRHHLLEMTTTKKKPLYSGNKFCTKFWNLKQCESQGRS